MGAMSKYQKLSCVVGLLCLMIALAYRLFLV